MKKFTLLFIALVFLTKAYAQTLSFTLTTAPCHNDGVITANISGLTPPLTVTWNTVGISGTAITHTGVTGVSDVLTSYSGGPVYVSATDGSGGFAYNYYAGAPPFTYFVGVTPAVCPALGTATVTVTGGTAPYTYSWFNRATLAVASTTNPASLGAGYYGITITDNAGCVFGSMVKDDSSAATSIAAFSVSVTTTTANCTNGTATAVVGPGATLPLSYVWTTGGTTATITGLIQGLYKVAVTDALGCIADSTAGYVSQAITISAPTTPTPATCTNTDGSVIAFGSGGVPPYTFIWSNGATTASQTGLASGNYYVTATDANGCFGDGYAYIGSSTPITVTYSSTPSLCTSSTGTSTLSPIGGTAPYSYLWYTTPVQTTATATGLPAGNYSFKITDAVGCVRTGTVTVPPVNIINGAFSVINPLCTLSTGSLTITPTGGVAPYTYLWNTGATAASIGSLPTGAYTVTVTDNMGCKVNKCLYLAANSPLGIGISTAQSSCIFTPDGSITATPYGGTPPYTYSWSNGATTSTASGLLSGYYHLMVSDAMGCVAYRDWIYVGYNAATTSCYCTIQGTIYHDVNGNCVKDAGEPGVEDIQIYISGRGYTYTDPAGNYSMKVPSGTYTVTETIKAFYPLSSCQPNNIPVTAVAASGCTLPVNFANAINPIHSMHMCTWDYTKPVPGNSYDHVTIIKNEGTVTESAVLSGYKPDGQLFSPVFVPSGIFSGSPYYYNTAGGGLSLSPGASQTFYMNYNVPASIPIGTSVLFKDSTAYIAPMSNWLTDYSPWDNTNYFTTTVIGPYDPNFKEVYPKGYGSTGIITYDDSVLDYMVHFQNVGSYYAQNVVVLDTLDNNLDFASLMPTYMSAPCQVTLELHGPYRIAKFVFNNINLPAQSMDDLRSNGMLSYSIKTKSGLAMGTQFKNSASIYFDYNAPVKTNATLNTIGIPGSVNTLPESDPNRSFVIYPNPASKTFNTLIMSENEVSAVMQLTDVTGKTLMNQTIGLHVGSQTITTDASQLAPGLYFVSLNENGKISTQKLVIIK